MFSHELEAAGVRQGAILAGKYRVDGLLGVGGMGIVIAAYHVQLDDRVAIKFLRPDCLDNPEAVARFRREARAAVKIKGEHVARVMDVGALANGMPYMVMEYLEGADLAGWLRRSGPLRIEQAVEFILQACEAIAEAHALGIVHRDLKPANLFVVRRPDGTPAVKVLDFGISKRAPGMASNTTEATAMVGSPLYMSPEQIRGDKDADARSDIWSLGVILYELLTGEPAFRAATMPELVHRIQNAAPAAPREKRPELPQALEAAVLQCLAKRRAQRYANVGALALALCEFGNQRARASAERVANIVDGAALHGPAWAISSRPRARSGQHATLRLWPHATTFTGKRAVRVGMGSAALVAIAAYFWVSVETPPKLVEQPATLTAPATAAPVPPAPQASPQAARPASAPALAGGAAGPVLEPRPGSNATRAARRGSRPRPAARGIATAAPPAAALPSAHVAVAVTPAPQPTIAAPEPPAMRERDASVSGVGDDLRGLKRTERRGIDVEDPFR